MHVCLVGQKVSNDSTLLQKLKAKHQVTLMKEEHMLLDNSALCSAEVLLLDCTGCSDLGPKIIEPLKQLKTIAQRLCVVMVNGGLTQQRIRACFRKGARDYFSEPYDVDLMVERLEVLSGEMKSK